MAKNYICDGKVVEYLNAGTETILSGSALLMGQTLGVAMVDIAPGKKGSVQIEGVFSVPKKAVDVLLVGDAAHWNVEEGSIVKASTGNIPVGKVYADAPANAATVQVKLNA